MQGRVRRGLFYEGRLEVKPGCHGNTGERETAHAKALGLGRHELVLVTAKKQ